MVDNNNRFTKINFDVVSYCILQSKAKKSLILNSFIKKSSETLIIIYCLFDAYGYKKIVGLLKKILTIYTNSHVIIFPYVYNKQSIMWGWTKEHGYSSLDFGISIGVTELNDEIVKNLVIYCYERLGFTIGLEDSINVDNMKVICNLFKNTYKNINYFVIDENDKTNVFESEIDCYGYCGILYLDEIDLICPKYKIYDEFDIEMFHKFNETII
jgi:hypothetical protein